MQKTEISNKFTGPFFFFLDIQYSCVACYNRVCRSSVKVDDLCQGGWEVSLIFRSHLLHDSEVCLLTQRHSQSSSEDTPAMF